MKLLENTVLDSVASYIVDNAVDFNMDLRLESYSRKMVNLDKREWKRSMQNQPDDALPGGGNGKGGKNCGNQLHLLSCTPEDWGLNSISPLNSHLSVLGNGLSIRNRHLSETSGGSDGGDIMDVKGLSTAKTVSKRCLFDMISLLNLSYPDYDFSETRSHSFTSWTLEECMANVNGRFLSTVNNYGRIRDHLWKAIDNEIGLHNECIVYSYLPGYDSESPFTEDGCIWSFDYLFCSKRLKRFLFFACRALRPVPSSELASPSPGTEVLWSMEIGE